MDKLKINLQDKMKDVVTYGKSFRIVKFDNGFSVAYERQNVQKREVMELANGDRDVQMITSPETFIAYGLLPPRGSLPGGHNADILGSNKPASFSNEAEDIAEDYVSKKDRWIERVERGTQELYKEAIAPLNIKEFKHRDWKELGQGSLFAFGWPILLPYYMIQGHKSDHSGDGGLAVLFAPLLIPYIIKGLVIPSETSLKVENTKLLTRDSEEGKNVALDLNYSGNPRKFDCIELILENGLEISSSGYIFDGRKEDYKKAQWFMKVDERIKEAFCEAHESTQGEWNRWRNFREELKENNQEGLMELIGLQGGI